MPIYEFQCKKCGHRFERMQKMSDPQPAACPQCKAKGTVEQLMSAPAAHFKGSGWYVTDYAKKGSTPSTTSGETKSDAKTEVKAASTSEKKAETKTTSKSEHKSASPDKK